MGGTKTQISMKSATIKHQDYMCLAVKLFLWFSPEKIKQDTSFQRVEKQHRLTPCSSEIKKTADISGLDVDRQVRETYLEISSSIMSDFSLSYMRLDK